jgi:hypothetical protein
MSLQDWGRFTRRMSFAPIAAFISHIHTGVDALVYDPLISMGRTSRPFSAPGLALREALTWGAYAVGVLY